MKQAGLAVVLVWIVAAAFPSGAGELFARTYKFKPGVRLEIGAEVTAGLRLDHVRFYRSASLGRRMLGGDDRWHVEVRLTNTGQSPERFGIAFAVLDEEGQLLGVASGGSKLLPVKPGRHSYYTLTFEDVHRELDRAASFMVAVEPR